MKESQQDGGSFFQEKKLRARANALLASPLGSPYFFFCKRKYQEHARCV